MKRASRTQASLSTGPTTNPIKKQCCPKVGFRVKRSVIFKGASGARNRRPSSKTLAAKPSNKQYVPCGFVLKIRKERFCPQKLGPNVPLASAMRSLSRAKWTNGSGPVPLNLHNGQFQALKQTIQLRLMDDTFRPIRHSLETNNYFKMCLLLDYLITIFVKKNWRPKILKCGM